MTLDLTTILSKDSKLITNWDVATTNGEYIADVGAANAPTSDVRYVGTVIRGEVSITQKLYTDDWHTDEEILEYIRRGKITDTGIIWDLWYSITYIFPVPEE